MYEVVHGPILPLTDDVWSSNADGCAYSLAEIIKYLQMLEPESFAL
jgi:hypothetical protein